MIYVKNENVIFQSDILPGDLLLVNKNRDRTEHQRDYFTYFILSHEKVKNIFGHAYEHIVQSKMIVFSLEFSRIHELKFFDSEMRDSKFIIIRK